MALIASLPLELIDRWPPSIAYHSSLLGSGFTLENNARVGGASVQTESGGCYGGNSKGSDLNL